MNMIKTCEVEILDMLTGEPAFNIQLYGVSKEEMARVPPKVSLWDALDRRGIDPHRYTSSLFHIREARRFRP